jgi:exosortase family protein XrtM
VHAQKNYRHPLLKFILIFGGLTLLFWELSFTQKFNALVMSPCTAVMANLSFFLLKALGQPVTLSHTIISSTRVSLEITDNCNGIYPVWYFIAAVVSFPAAYARKILAFLLGAPLLLAVNVVRIVTLYFIKLTEPAWFDWVHLQVWPALFIMVTVCAGWFWLHWLVHHHQWEPRA